MNHPLLNNIEIVNELFTLASVYFLLFFTEWCSNQEVRSFAGKLYMQFLIAIIIINFLMIAFEMISQLLGKHILRLKAKISRFLNLRS